MENDHEAREKRPESELMPDDYRSRGEETAKPHKRITRRTMLASLGITSAVLAAGGLNRLGGPGTVSAQWSVYGSGNDSVDKNGKTKPKELMALDYCIAVTLAGLRAMTDPDPSWIYYVTDAGQEGPFYYEAGDLTSPDNNAGTVLVGATGARFKRIVQGEVNVRWFGAKGDGLTDDTAKVQAALDTGLGVYIPEGRYRISSTLIMRTPGQQLRGATKQGAAIFNDSTDARLLSVGDPAVNQNGMAPYSSIRDLGFEGNASTVAGITLFGKLSANATWKDASKNVSLSNLVINHVGAGTALEVFTWSNTITGLTLYTGNKAGIVTMWESNANNWSHLYITGCAQESIVVGGQGVTRGNSFTSVVVQQSGGPAGAIDIRQAENVLLQGLYSEANNRKGAPCVVNVQDSASAVSVRNVNHLGGGAIVVRNAGTGTIIENVVSSNLTGAIVQVTGTKAVTFTSDVRYMDGVVPRGAVYADLSANKQSLFFDGRKLTAAEIIIEGHLRPSDDNVRNLGSSTNRWAAVYSSTGVVTTSDGKLKTDISDETLGLDFVDKWRPRVYKRSDNGDTQLLHHGFIAQEFKAVLDEFGVEHAAYVEEPLTDEAGRDTGSVRCGLRYEQLIAHLTLAVQQLAQQVRELKAGQS
ncbi:glycosyl hydrolase family 28-related protein [Paenibacillus sp. GCM10012303]|uniref:glycosyl hydrolase family 28-related protein n=1 Tax=Paenibacillus sp. GCM10012303 TaxID=3317340 RepID=UPI0036D213FB